MAEYKLLPAFCKPYEDELLSSWLTRMAFDHGLSTKDFCGQIWEHYTNRDIDRTISKENLQAIAEQTDCSFEQVQATTLVGYDNHIFTSPADRVIDNWVLGSNSQGSSWGPGLLYCPKCLVKKPYFKKQWRLAISFACTECHCYLNECCPHCGSKSCLMAGRSNVYTAHTNTAYLLTCHACGNDVTKCIPKPAGQRVIAMQKRLYNIVAEGVNEKVIYTESYFSVLHHLAKLLIVVRKPDAKNDKKLLRFIMKVYRANGFVEPVEINHTYKLVRRLPLNKRAMVTTAACWMLEDWPNRFITLCTKNDITSKMVLGNFKNAPFWFWEVVNEHLSWLPSTFNNKCVEDQKLIETHSEYIINIRDKECPDYDFDVNTYYYDMPTGDWNNSLRYV